MSSRDLASDNPSERRGRVIERDVSTKGRSRDARANISLVLLIVDLLVLVMTVGGVHGPLRFIFGLLFGVVVPGWSIVGLLHLDNAALETGLAIAVSLSSLMVVAQILMSLHAWHLGALEIVVCLACLPSLARLSRRHRSAEASPT